MHLMADADRARGTEAAIGRGLGNQVIRATWSRHAMRCAESHVGHRVTSTAVVMRSTAERTVRDREQPDVFARRPSRRGDHRRWRLAAMRLAIVATVLGRERDATIQAGAGERTLIGRSHQDASGPG